MRKIGEEVTIRKDISSGDTFDVKDSGGRFSIIVSDEMEKYKGCRATIKDYTYREKIFVGYELDISPMYVYTEGMFEKEYTDSIYAEELINHMLKLIPSQLIDHSLDKKDKNLFIKLTSNSVDKRQTTWYT